MVKFKVMKRHFLASEAWSRFQKTKNLETIFAEGKGWLYAAIVETDKINPRLYCPRSPQVESVEALQAALKDLETKAKENDVWFVRIEPDGANINSKDLIGLGYHRVKDYQPSLTWLLDLSPSEDELIANMKQANRNLYRNYQKKGLEFCEADSSDEIEHLIKLFEKISQHKTVKFHPPKYFRNLASSMIDSGSAHLFHVKKDGKIIASSLVYDDNTTRYYAHAASDHDQRKLGAGSVLLTNMIIDAKRRGLKSFDFYGVTDSANPDHPWYGFTKFKQSFGGEYYRYLGTWEKPIKALPYWIYRQVLKLTRLLKKIRP